MRMVSTRISSIALVRSECCARRQFGGPLPVGSLRMFTIGLPCGPDRPIWSQALSGGRRQFGGAFPLVARECLPHGLPP